MKLYSNKDNINLISSMITKRREPHSIVICGEKGQGKKTLAKYIAAQLMCETNKGKPCGSCKACRMLEHNTHPDFITATANENGNYQVESIRQLVSDSVTKPNDSEFKVYLISDLDRSNSTSVQVQNILLKLIEEPPRHCVVIVTASTKQIFLPTIISRVLCLTAQPCTCEESTTWLEEKGKYTPQQIKSAVECGHGNFGRCLEFLEGSVLPVAYDIAHECTKAIVNKDEYSLLISFLRCDGKKVLFRQVLVFLSEIARDACTSRLGISGYAGCYVDGAKKLSEIINEIACGKLYEVICDSIKKVDCNSNLTLTINSLTGEICRVVNCN